MKKKITFEKSIEFSTMIGEITEISLDQELKFINESNIEGDLLLTGKYKMTEASRLEENFSYKIPCEIELTEELDLNTTNVEISDFYYEIENDNTLICHIELLIEGLEILKEESVVLERECDGDKVEVNEVEISKEEKKEEIVEEKNNEVINSLFSNLDDENDRYGTFVVYMVRQNETINTVIEKYHTTIEELEKYNDLKNINIGTKLIIPLINE